MKKFLITIAGFALLIAGTFQSAWAAKPGSYEAEDVLHGTGRNGLTGLYYTVIPYTIGTGLSVNAHAEVASAPGVTTTVTPFSVTLGLGKNFELSGVSSLYSGGGVSATGDSEINLKYYFRAMGEVVPAMALVLGVTLPTASDPLARDVVKLGGKISVVGGGDAQVSDNMVVGSYFNVTANFIDPGEVTQNNYLSSSVGLMIPISDNNKLQGFIDARLISGKTGATLSGADGTTYMIGLRYATRFLKITGGIEKVGGASKAIGGIALEI